MLRFKLAKHLVNFLQRELVAWKDLHLDCA